LPLRDTDMIWIDRNLGFDWLAVMSALDHLPRLLDVLNGAYATFTAQLLGAAAVLVAAGRMRDLDRFFIIFACASISAEALSVLVPTLGPIWALADHARFTNLPTLGRTTAEIVLVLRNKTLGTIDFEAVNGIISFPSMHAAVAIIVPYTLRWNRRLFAPIAALNAVMLASAVPSGNHYVVDIIAGIAVAVLAIEAGERFKPRSIGCSVVAAISIIQGGARTIRGASANRRPPTCKAKMISRARPRCWRSWR
jgi:hypothetical protein